MSKELPDDEYWMQQALLLAQKAEAQGEVPVGAVVVRQGRIIGEGWNQVISLNDPSAHAEVLALRAAAKNENNYRLPGSELFVTIEPCTMCFGTLVHARIQRVVYGAKEPRAGMLDSNVQISELDIYNHKLQWQGGILEQACSDVISQFFRKKREP